MIIPTKKKTPKGNYFSNELYYVEYNYNTLEIRYGDLHGDRTQIKRFTNKKSFETFLNEKKEELGVN